jgi:hypothetical protein
MAAPDQKMKDRVVALFAEGNSLAQIMLVTNLSRGQVAGIIHRSKAPTSRKPDVGARRKDELALEAVRLRASGLNLTQTAARLGQTVKWANLQTHCILRDDLKYSGEPAGAVRRAYW